MARLDDLEFVISANTNALRNDLARGTDAINAFAKNTETSIERSNVSLRSLRRGINDILGLYGAMRVIRLFSGWVEDAANATDATDSVKTAVLELSTQYDRLHKASQDVAGGAIVASAPIVTGLLEQWARKLEAFHTSWSAFAREVIATDPVLQSFIDPSKERRRRAQPAPGPGAYLSAGVASEQQRVGRDDSAVNGFIADMNNAVEARSQKEDDFLTNFIADMNNAMSDRSRDEDAFLTNFVADMNNAVAEREKAESEFLDNFIGEMNTAIAQRESHGQDISPDLSMFIDQVKAADELTKSLRTDWEEQNDTFREAQALYAQGLVSEETVERASRAGRAMKDFADATTASLESRGVQALVDGDISGAFKGLAQDLVELIVKMTILKPLADQLAQSFSKIAYSKDNGGGLLAALLGGSLGGDGSHVPIDTIADGFASGGRPPMGRASWIGEDGPELWVPDTAGRIMSNAESRSMMGGAGVTIVQHIQAGLPPQWDVQLAGATRIAATVASEAVTKSLGRRR